MCYRRFKIYALSVLPVSVVTWLQVVPDRSAGHMHRQLWATNPPFSHMRPLWQLADTKYKNILCNGCKANFTILIISEAYVFNFFSQNAAAYDILSVFFVWHVSLPAHWYARVISFRSLCVNVSAVSTNASNLGSFNFMVGCPGFSAKDCGMR